MHIGIPVGYESTNIYRVWIPIKKKIILIREVIFDEEEVWDGKPISYSDNDIKKRDKAIERIEVLELEAKEMEDIQLGKDYKVETAITTIKCQIDHEAEDLDIDHGKAEKEADDDNQKWAQGQYLTPDPSILEAFLANSVNMPVQR